MTMLSEKQIEYIRTRYSWASEKNYELGYQEALKQLK